MRLRAMRRFPSTLDSLRLFRRSADSAKVPFWFGRAERVDRPMGTLAVVIEWEGNPGLSRPGVDQVLGAMAVATRPWQPAPWSLAHESAPGAVPSPACAFGVGAGVAGGGACLVSADSTLGAFDGRLDRDVLAQIGARDGVVDGAELLRAFRARGPELFARMHGDWVLVLVDFQTRTVSAARSPLGDRPLYYGRTRDRLLFATHIEQILAVEGVERVLDEQHVLEYMTWDIESAPSTAFRDIHRVAPGHRVSANSAHREPSQARYWFPRAPSREWRSDQQCMDAFSAAFERAVRERIVSHSPILAQLSGGLDSSSIVCMANRIYGARGSDDASRLAPLHVASAVYPGMDCDESELIRAVVDRVQFRAHAWDGRGAVRLEAGELASPWSLWPSGFVAGDLRIAHQLGARVILSGHGGDEIGFEVGIFRDFGAGRTLVGVAARDALGSACACRAKLVVLHVAKEGWVFPGRLEGRPAAGHPSACATPSAPAEPAGDARVVRAPVATIGHRPSLEFGSSRPACDPVRCTLAGGLVERPHQRGHVLRRGCLPGSRCQGWTRAPISVSRCTSGGAGLVDPLRAPTPAWLDAPHAARGVLRDSTASSGAKAHRYPLRGGADHTDRLESPASEGNFVGPSVDLCSTGGPSRGASHARGPRGLGDACRNQGHGL